MGFSTGEHGFTLIEMLMVSAMVVIIAGMGIPLLSSTSAAINLGEAARQVERELQTARLTAVSANRPMRVRFNCPAAGEYRMTELIGTPATPAAADSAINRCSMTPYPFPAADRNPLTRPNNDGPLRTLNSEVTFQQSTTIEFWPDGSAHATTGTTNPWPVITGTGTSIILARGTKTRTIVVNSIGKVQLLP
jgi:prepilin-type N-terminal cleavage/methylation domain-containing protein